MLQWAGLGGRNSFGMLPQAPTQPSLQPCPAAGRSISLDGPCSLHSIGLAALPTPLQLCPASSTTTPPGCPSSPARPVHKLVFLARPVHPLTAPARPAHPHTHCLCPACAPTHSLPLPAPHLWRSKNSMRCMSSVRKASSRSAACTFSPASHAFWMYTWDSSGSVT